MLTRRQIRIKVMQALYAHLSEEEGATQICRSLLKNSMESVTGLYLSLCSLLVALQNLARLLATTGKQSYVKEAHSTLQNNIAENQLIRIIAKNDFKERKLKKYNIINWDVNGKYVKLIYDSIQRYPNEKQYDNNFEGDKQLLTDIYYKVIAPNEKLYECLEETELTWLDDLPFVNTHLFYYLKDMVAETSAPSIFTLPFKDTSDEAYAYNLLNHTLSELDRLTPIISKKTINWDTKRIAKIDIILIKMALTESLHFPNIPTKVTINEYVEISKEYATPKSNVFINGILDTIIKDFQSEGRIQKLPTHRD